MKGKEVAFFFSCINNKHRFLSSVWFETLAGDQLQTSYDSDEPKNVLSCENLSVTVPFKKKYLGLKRFFKPFKKSSYELIEAGNDTVLLDKVSAEIKGGEILAVLGPSGAGKTLFLSSLLGNPSVKDSKISGKVFLNGRPLKDQTQSESVAFVPQKDLAVESLTVDEHLQFFAALRMWRETKQARTARINELLSQMNLEKCRRSELRFISGGERKRISIATQIIVRPAILLLDEPLTGLDAAVSDTIIAAVARIAQPTPSAPQGCCVICVLHQPRPQTLRFVSKVMLMTDGRVACYGTPDEAEKFYYRLNPKSELQFGAWNAILESFMAKLHTPETANHIVDTYRHDVCHPNDLHASVTAKSDVPKQLPLTRAPWRTQLSWLLWRETADSKQRVFNLSTATFAVTAIVFGMWYAKSTERNQAGIQSASGLLFMVSSEIIYTNAYSVMHSFTPQIPMVLREKRLYGPSAYFLAKVFSLVPRATLQTILFTIIVQFSGNLSGDGGIEVFLPICGILIIVSVASTSFGCMLAAVSNRPEKAYMIAQPIDLISNSLGGIFGQVSHHFIHLDAFKYISTFFYSFECLSILYWDSVKTFDCPELTPQCPTSDSVLAVTGFSAKNLQRDIILLCVYIIVCNCIGFLGLSVRFKNHAVY